MKNNLTVWYWGNCPSYYLKRPWKWFKELWCNIKNAHDRITKGYCFLDWSNFDTWFENIVPNMLRDIADKGCAYPGGEPFETREKWHEWLYKMADQLNRCNEEWCEENNINEYQEEYMKLLDEARNSKIESLKVLNQKATITSYDFKLTTEQQEIQDKYLKREREIYEQQRKLIKETLTELGEHWGALWD